MRALVPSHDPAHPEADAFGLIFAECHINYRSPVLFDEEVAVVCSIGNVKRSSFRVEFEMRVGTRLAAEGYGVLVGFDYVSQQASQLPDELRQTLETEAGATAGAVSSD
jgi:acyl-CoA thioester hydrolase